MRRALLLLIILPLMLAACNEAREAAPESEPRDAPETPPNVVPAPIGNDLSRYGNFDEPPRVVVQVPPEYPEMARKADLEGVVMVLISLDEFGNVEEATVIQGIEGLNQAAIDAAIKWKFKPAKCRDIPVRVRIVIPVRFKLED